ncbi:MAG: EF-hand domain-containing protein [Nostoc sp. NMS7]|uniref:EF-hand domain-containing protein n=1 Tax=Nostoc sp. NMS7 TaxID=2815391 RepID=UPI0025E791EA|nr:EF-hand domain-containing protein [Nostoc sp. NMS7]MBN3945941.1 EF-hand domain-containing protein [Nostoc sp. NMS7]
MATVEQLQNLFTIVDQDRDGKVSINELYSNGKLGMIFSLQAGVYDRKELLEKADSDKDGSITFEEFKKQGGRIMSISKVYCQ